MTPRRAAARDVFDHDPRALRAQRVKAGKLARDVALAAGISPGYLSELERGTRNPSPPTLAALASALGCLIEDLMPKPTGVS